MKTTQTWKIGDCLQLLPEIPDKSIDMILTDLPYGTTECAWDSIIDLSKLWVEYERIIKDNSPVVLTAQTPFDKVLGSSNLKYLRYEWIWIKDQGTGGMNSHKMPLKIHENVLVFYKKLPVYNPIFHTGKSYKIKRYKPEIDTVYGKTGLKECFFSKNNGVRYPTSELRFGSDTGLHPTQKPLALWEYLIKTYTNEGDTVHDSCLGSGTTLEACANLNRNCIGFELLHDWEEHYRKRLRLDNTKLDAFNTSA